LVRVLDTSNSSEALTYCQQPPWELHLVGGGTPDERDLETEQFERQLEELQRFRVVGLDAALDELDRGDETPKVVLTFDDGFAEVYTTAWPRLRDAGLPFTLYVTTAYLDGLMHWPGSTSQHPGPALTWQQLEELAASPLVTIGNHTHTHARPEALTAEELDTCSELLEQRLGVSVRRLLLHVGGPGAGGPPLLERGSGRRRPAWSAGTTPLQDRLDLHRIPVRGTDPLGFFRAKLSGGLGAERAYERIVQTAKRAGARG
jgi:peptidoglycan/xylan/chitin deacetylase (PgdA/CDA1 family)